MVYYHVVSHMNNKQFASPPKRLHSDTIGHPPLQPINKRALLSCLKKMENVLKERTDLPLLCVENALAWKDHRGRFHEWLWNEFFVFFTEDEVEQLLDYLELHNWGHIIVEDTTIVKKMFDVPNSLSQASWNANIDNMQVRNQFKNSLLRYPMKTSSLKISQPIYADRKKGYIINRNDVISTRNTRLEQLQQKYLTRIQVDPKKKSCVEQESIPPKFTGKPRNHMSAAQLAARPLPKKLVVLSKERKESIAREAHYKRSSYDGSLVIDYSGSARNGKDRRKCGDDSYPAEDEKKMSLKLHNMRSRSIYHERDSVIAAGGEKNSNANANPVTTSAIEKAEPSRPSHRAVSMSIQLPRVKVL